VTTPTQSDRQRAEETLSYIRETMESSSTFTAVSGWGLVSVGGTGLIASWLAWASGASIALRVWVPAALVALILSSTGNALKARRMAVPLWSGSFRKVVWGLVPALIAGAFLTFALRAHGAAPVIPGTWLAVYGAGVAAGGMFSVRALRWMGLVLLGMGSIALLNPDLGLVMLAGGFGGVHAVFGLYIAYRHGG